MGQPRGKGLPVVVGIDGSSSALEAARWAAREAARRGTSVDLVSAFGFAATRHIGDPGVGGDFREALMGRSRDDLAAAAGAAAQAAPDIAISQRVADGFPVPALAAESAGAALVVIGDRGLGGFTSLLVGSVAIGLVARAHCPVVVVRGDHRSDAGPVVVGIDGSEISDAALAFAVQAADARKVPLIAVHAWIDTPIQSALAPLVDVDAVDAGEREVLDERLAAWVAKYPGLTVRRVVVRDKPAHALIQQTTHTTAQLLVVGSHGRGSAAGLLLGSVGNAVLHHSPCPVAVVRPEEW
ncbi:universal stress protein [Actinocrispum sp. NPDC049592]|uniref:universal stress protein n=1 Tax=Actinocrispum sp. NPDC049592 TaxID=3154835 RepID=UPI00341CC56B